MSTTNSELIFKGPYHINEITTPGIRNFKTAGAIDACLLNGNIATLPKQPIPGIYIWGFMYHYDNYGVTTESASYDDKNQLIGNDTNLKFIPYYVGKHQKNIIGRLRQHHNVQKGDAPKYTRLSHSYMKHFFINFPINIKADKKNYKNKIRAFITSNPSAINYFNDEEILKSLYPLPGNILITKTGRKYSDCPIDLQKLNSSPLPNTLEDLIITKKNFWFCFAPHHNNHNLRKMETYTFWSLKGITIGQTDHLGSLFGIHNTKESETTLSGTAWQNIQYNSPVINYTNQDIFKMNDDDKVYASRNFPGY